MENTISQRARIFSLLVVLALFGTVLYASYAIVPEGADIVYRSNSSKNVTAATGRTDAKGQIHTIVLNSTQQDSRWKAYVGNVSGRLVLSDAADFRIYEWTVTESFSGEVYVSRNDSISWANVGCANSSNKETEDTYLNHTSTSSDSINQTFDGTKHAGFWVGDVVQITNSTCPTIKTYVNNSAQSDSESALFQEIMLYDSSTANVIYTTILEQDAQGYRDDFNLTGNDEPGDSYDFQVLLPDSAIVSTTTKYYFYVELST